jgi:RNA polymerase sigma-70 factor, ECF subfamily
MARKCDRRSDRMGEDDWLAVRFEENRDRDVLRRRREHPVAEPSPTDPVIPNPEHEALQAESVGLALLVVLETLTLAERLAFVLHDMFAVPYDDIAPIVGRTPAAARQLASRARRQVQQPRPTTNNLKPTPPCRVSGPARENRQRELVTALLDASRGGDFAALLEVLDPEVVLRADSAAAAKGAASLVRGAPAVAETFSGRAAAARLVLVNGIAGAVWSHRGEPQVVFQFTFAAERITAIDLLGDPDYLRDVKLGGLDD